MSGFRSRKWRSKDREHVQPVEQVLAKRAGRHQLLERPMRGRDQAHVDADAVRAAEPLDFPFLQRPQELDLGRHVHVADLVQEQRAALGQLEATLLERVGARERPLLVAEQLGFDQAAGQRRAAHLDERLLRAGRVVVDRVRDHLLAGARLAPDEHRRVRPRDLRHLFVDRLDRRAVADDVAKGVAVARARRAGAHSPRPGAGAPIPPRARPSRPAQSWSPPRERISRIADIGGAA